MESLTNLLPEAITPLAAIAVLACAFLASGLTAALGLGGGLFLLAAMGALLPVFAVIPVHGVAQLGSNAGRTLLQYRYIVWPIVTAFAIGCVIGTWAGGQILMDLPAALLKAAVGGFVLFSLYGPKLKFSRPGNISFVVTGAVGGFLTLFFGATGPLAASIINAANLPRFQTVATHAAAMSLQHALKILTFGILGFAYADWAWLLLGLLVTGFAGTWVGTHILKRLPERQFRLGFKIMLTAIALYLLISALFETFTVGSAGAMLKTD